MDHDIDLNLKTLKTFHRIVINGSFIRAAEEMNYAQSTVTMQIKKLEADLGVQLLERGKQVRLTEAGQLFYEQSLEIVRQLERLRGELNDLGEGEAGTVRLGVTEPTATMRLPQLLKSFMEEHPRVRLALEIAGTPSLREKVLAGSIDFALCNAPSVGEELYFQPLFYEAFLVLLPEDHPLTAKAIIVPQDLQGQRLFITSPTCPYRHKLELLLQENGGISVSAMEISSMSALKSYVEAGLGIALVPAITINPVPSGTVARPLEGARIDMLSGLLLRASGNPPLTQASRKLYRYLESKLRAL